MARVTKTTGVDAKGNESFGAMAVEESFDHLTLQPMKTPKQPEPITMWPLIIEYVALLGIALRDGDQDALADSWKKLPLDLKDEINKKVQEIDDQPLPPEIEEIPWEEQDFESMTLIELATMMKGLKDAHAVADEHASLIKARYEFLSIKIIPDRMDEEGVETMRIKGVGRLQAAGDIYCSVPKENKEDLQKWLRDNGHGSMIKEEVNASTFKAFVKERMKEEKEYPKDLIKVTPYTRATVVKG